MISGSSLGFDGVTTFDANRASAGSRTNASDARSGGALYVHGSSATWKGQTIFSSNVASAAGVVVHAGKRQRVVDGWNRLRQYLD